MITDKERQAAVDLLVKTRQTVIDAVSGLTEEQARWTPSPDRWCILQYLEHLAISDDALIALVKRALETPATPETLEQRKEREAKIRATPVPRGVNNAPAGLRPQFRFATVPQALDAFLAARERTLDFAATTQDDLRSHFQTHPVLGPMDAYQWMAGNGRHAETHAGHIRELREMPEFPQA
jgi:hypothetical protein